jgi:putative oxidoreductase
MRIVLALLLLQHGGQKVFGYPTISSGAAPLSSLLGIAGIVELVGGWLLLMGMFTRLTALLLAVFMAASYFMVHAPGGWWPIHNQGELDVACCVVFLYLSAAGPGPWSVDQCRCRKCCATPPASPPPPGEKG